MKHHNVEFRIVQVGAQLYVLDQKVQRNAYGIPIFHGKIGRYFCIFRMSFSYVVYIF